MQALKASAVASSCSKDPSLPTQDGVGQFSPLLQFARFYWEDDEHAGRPPLMYPNTTKGHSPWPQESPITCCTVAQLQRGWVPALLAQAMGWSPGNAQGALGKPSAGGDLNSWVTHFLCGGCRLPHRKLTEIHPCCCRGKSVHLPLCWLEPGRSQLNSSTLWTPLLQSTTPTTTTLSLWAEASTARVL